MELKELFKEIRYIIQEKELEPTKALMEIKGLIDSFDKELKDLEIRHKKASIKDLELGIKRKRILNMIDKLELWSSIRTSKTLKDLEEKYKKGEYDAESDKYSKLHI